MGTGQRRFGAVYQREMGAGREIRIPGGGRCSSTPALGAT